MTPWTVAPPGSSVRGIFQASIPEQVAISSSRGSSRLRDRTLTSCISCARRRILHHCGLKTQQRLTQPLHCTPSVGGSAYGGRGGRVRLCSVRVCKAHEVILLQRDYLRCPAWHCQPQVANVRFQFIKIRQLFFILSFSSPMWLCQRRQWHPTPALLPGESHGWRSLVGCSPWGREESDTTERLHFHFSLSHIGEGNGNPLQCSCLENRRDGRTWWAAVSGVTQSQTRLKPLSSSGSMRLCR